MLVHLEGLGKVLDPPGQQRDLDLRRAGVTLTGRVPGDDLFLHGGLERHVAPWLLDRHRTPGGYSRDPDRGRDHRARPTPHSFPCLPPRRPPYPRHIPRPLLTTPT